MTLPQLDAIEIHTGMLLGRRRTPPPEDRHAAERDARAVLDRLLAGALAGEPCHVSFSGGRDSSIILAAATRVARREGLPDPIPLTARYPWHPATAESEWQEAVVRHLALREWTVFEMTTELDALGEVATALLRRHGVYAPTPAHSMAVFARRAGDGTLLTGTGGDEVLSDWGFRRRPLRELVTERPRQRAPRRLAVEALPVRLRNRVRLRGLDLSLPAWLRPAARRRVEALWRDDPSWSDATWRKGLEGMLATRSYEVTRTTLDAFARQEGVRLVEPFFDPAFVYALARTGPRMGFASRTEAVERLFGDLLPPDVARRGTKAVFNAVLAGPGMRAFAEDWDGSGVDIELVDPAALRAEWRAEVPDVRCLPALQHAWLAAQ